MPPRKAEARQDPPPFWVAAADIPAPHSTESGRAVEFAYRAGDRVSVAAVERHGWQALVHDPRKDDQQEPPGPGEEK